MSAAKQESVSKGREAATLKKLLGSLELEVMEFMWEADEATVQQAVDAFNQRRPVAYTTVMTVMGHLVEKRLLTRIKERKKYRYRVALSRDEFLQDRSRRMVHALVNDFGDLAIAQFLGEIDEIGPDSLRRLRALAQRSGGEDSASE